jgi:hypothetical protein
VYFLSLIKYNKYIEDNFTFLVHPIEPVERREINKYKTEIHIFDNLPEESNARFKRNAGGNQRKGKCSQTSIAGTKRKGA